MVHDLREIVRIAECKELEPTAAIFDGRTLRSTPESCGRAGYDGYKKTQGSKVHLAVDTLGLLLGLVITPANEQERAQVGELSADVQEETEHYVEIAFVDQGYTGSEPAQAAKEQGIELDVVRLPGAKKGFVLLTRRWVIERSNARFDWGLDGVGAAFRALYLERDY